VILLKRFSKKILTALLRLDIDKVERLVKDALDQDIKAYEILQILIQAMNQVGERFEVGEFFLSDLIMAGEIMGRASDILKPHLSTVTIKARGKVVLGTILGDLHDIGKNIVKTLLISAGMEVYDLGIDVPPINFVKKAEEVNAEVIGISALLTTTVPSVGEVVKELYKTGLRTRVKVIIGGAAVRNEDIKLYGVDAAVNDAIKGVKTIESWLSEASD